MTPLTPREDTSVPYVTQHASHLEWLGVFGLWFVLNFAGLPFFLQELPQVAWWQFTIILLEDGITWVVMTVVLFHLFDRTPFVAGARVRNTLIRIVAVVVLALGQAQFIWIVGFATARAISFPQEALEPPYFERSQLNADAIFYATIALAVHAWLRKVIQTRLAAQRTARLEGQLATARLHALSTELQPHFLFNTLNGIAALIPEDPEQAESMLLNLSDLLRHTLDGGGPQGVTLGQELERLDLYLDIQKMRLGSRLQTSRNIDPEALNARVPGMILQPLVENAIRHGLERRSGPGSIAISATEADGRVVVEVVDDGAGLPPDAQYDEGIGISNTRGRIETMFGTGSLTLGARPGGGVIARLDIPWEPMEPAATHEGEG